MEEMKARGEVGLGTFLLLTLALSAAAAALGLAIASLFRARRTMGEAGRGGMAALRGAGRLMDFSGTVAPNQTASVRAKAPEDAAQEDAEDIRESFREVGRDLWHAMERQAGAAERARGEAATAT